MHNATKKILSVVMALLLAFTSIPMAHVHAEEAVIETDKDTYEIGDPIYVTASSDVSGAWVGIYRTSEGAGDYSYWYYVSEHNGETINLGDGDVAASWNGWNLGADSFTVAVLDGSNNVLAQKEITITVGTTPETFTAQKDSYVSTEPVYVTAVSHEYERPWINITNSANESEWFYVPLHNGLIDLREYYIFKGTGNYTVTYYKNYNSALVGSVTINVEEALNSISLNKEGSPAAYIYGEPILVTAESIDPKAFVRLCDIGGTNFNDGGYFNAPLSSFEDGTIDIFQKALEAGMNFEVGTQYRIYLIDPMKTNPNMWVKNAKFELTEGYYSDDAHIDWTFAEDYSSATAVFHCTDNNEASDPYTAEVTKIRTLEPTCTEKGTDTYTATVTFTEENALPTVNGITSFTHSVDVDVDALDHDWSDWTVVTEPTYTAPGSEKRTCSRCDAEETREIAKLEATLTLNKSENYENNEPIIVTAVGGKWVGVFKKNEALSATGYFYKFDVDGEAHNIYSAEGKGTRGATFVASIPGAMDLTVYLFADEGVDNIITSVNTHINKPTGVSSLSVDKAEYDEGEAVNVSATSDARDAWVGIYQGTFSSTDTFSDTGLVDSFYTCYTDNAGKAIENLPAGDYTAVLFKYSSKTIYTVDKVVNFVVKGAEPLADLSTDKSSYAYGESIMVTTNYIADKSWVGLYKASDSVEADPSIYWYYVSSKPQTTDILTTDGSNGRTGELLNGGEFKVVLFADGGYTVLSQVAITIEAAPESNLVVDYASGYDPANRAFKYNQAINITPTTIYSGAWVGLYDYSNSDPLDTTLLDYYYVSDHPGTVNALDVMDYDLVPGHYKYILFTSGYDIDSGLIRSFWVLETYDDENVGFNLSEDKTSATVTFKRADDATVTKEYTATDITKATKSEPNCTTAGIDTYTINFTFPEGEELITVNDKTSFTGTVDVETPALGHAWGEWTVVTPATDDQPGVEKHVCTRCGEEETREIPVIHDHVLVHHEAKEATCTEAGNTEYWECSLCGKYFSDAEGTVEIDDKTTVVIAALGHDWSAWTFDEENHKHTRICSHDASHVETEDCTPGEAFYEDGKLMHKCTVCEGEWVEKVVLSTDKKEYDLWEQIMVTVNGEFGPRDWVGIYKKGDHYGDSNPNSPHYDAKAVKSIFWYYISEEPNPTDILRTRNENEREADYGPGEFTIYLFANDAYELITSVDVTVTEESVEIGDYVMKLNGEVQTNGQHTDLTVGDEAKVNITVDGPTGTAWVGLYNTYVGLDQDFTQFASTDWVWVRNHNGEDFSFPALDTSVPGEYTVVLFGNGGHDDARMAFTFKISKKIKEEVVTQEPTCTRPGNKRVTYDDGTFENIVIPALGHDYQFDSWEWVDDFSAAKAHFVCSHDEKHTEDVDAAVTSETLEDKIVYTAKAVFEGKDYTDVKEAPIPEPVKNEVVRLSGKDRYLTSLKAADELKAVLGVDKFDSVILATGAKFADALGGGYLAAKKGAPILLTSDKKAADINAYIRENLKEGGIVYVLGGTGAVSDDAVKELEEAGYAVRRLSGKTRYDTNLAILNEAGVSTEEILIASGENYADALAASATGRPMLLVNTKKNVLTDEQKAFLSEHSSNSLYILGGTGAVSEALEEAVSAYGTPVRLKGASRYETSVEIAKAFFPNAEGALIAYSHDFPDGLCAGPLAYALKSPILLTKEGKESSLKTYCTDSDIHSGYIVGGETKIPDASALDIFSLPEDTVIVKK